MGITGLGLAIQFLTLCTANFIPLPGTISSDVTSLLASTMRISTPLALGALSGLFCEKCGVVNIAIEGMMLASAFFGFIVGLYTQNLWIALAAALFTGAVLGLFHAVLSVTFKVDQIISGTVINILAIGITGYLNRQLFMGTVPQASPGTFPILIHTPIMDTRLIELPVLGLVLKEFLDPIVMSQPLGSVLKGVPLLGPTILNQQPLVLTTLILVLVSHIVIFYTPWGLQTRAVGEHPRAADTVGINVFFVRYVNVMIGGLIAGLAGAYFTLESIPAFEPLETNGRGFISLAAMIFGKWTAFGSWGAAMIFGFAEALQIFFQNKGITVLPKEWGWGSGYQFIGMLPYVLTMVVLAGVVGRAVPPAADGIPYEKS
ncbi:MAG: ABC transporter permease [Chloroflexi bacterium]|nr:ABC transporter permease [Chloroflexota bacterium]MBU1747368.1 ABC transporter permease [Chloroflexota bacterium]